METYKVTVDEYSTNWYKEDLLHREDGPAIECVNGDKFWYKEGELDRIDGPAIEYANGTEGWYLEGMKYTKSEFIKNNLISTYEGKIVEIDSKKYKLIELLK